MRRLVWAFAARIWDRYHNLMNWLISHDEIKYVNIIFIKMQNRATINLFLGTRMCVCAYIIPVMHS